MLWSPLESMLLYMEYTADSFPSWWPALEWTAYFMAYVSTALNPFIYAGMTKSYKSGFKSLTKRLACASARSGQSRMLSSKVPKK